MLLRHVRTQHRFQVLKLSEEPMIVRDSTAGPPKLLTNSRTYHGTFLSVASRKIKKIKEAPVSKGIDIQIPINEILGTMIQFAKDKPDVAQALCLQVVKSILAHSGAGFDARAALSRLVRDMLDSTLGELTPLAVEMGRILVDQMQVMPGFRNTMDKLKQSTKRTEGEAVISLLVEDLLLRSGEDVFVLPFVKRDETLLMEVEPSSATCLDDITSAFGKLSDWDKLTIQSKYVLKNSGLPQLWVDGDTFKSWIDSYEVPNTKSWFNKLVVTYKDESKQDGLRWLKETDRWPRDHFHVSTKVVINEAESTGAPISKGVSQGSILGPLLFLIYINDLPHFTRDLCETVLFADDTSLLFKARRGNDRYDEVNCALLKRMASPSSDSISEDISLPGDLELMWCKEANDRMLPHLALNCASVNINGAMGAAQLVSWHIEKARALRTIGLDNEDMDMLKEFLSILEPSKCDLISNMADVLGSMADLGISCRSEMLLSVILNRLDDIDIVDEATSKKLLGKICTMISGLNEFSLEAIKGHVTRFPVDVIDEFPDIRDAVTQACEEDNVRRCLQLVCDPRHSLSLRCAKLLQINDPQEWRTNFDLLKANMFENPYAASSTEYNLLNKYRDDFYKIEHFEATDHSQRILILDKVLKDLSQKVTDRRTLRLSQLCPALTQRMEVGSERDRCMSRLLRLGKLSLVKFYEQVSGKHLKFIAVKFLYARLTWGVDSAIILLRTPRQRLTRTLVEPIPSGARGVEAPGGEETPPEGRRHPPGIPLEALDNSRLEVPLGSRRPQTR
ncbi:hypothetical protein evm_004598 [Chilo suppressalis]|nr:hypothetical protein evm_004598 [Chilo suppressalis]